MVPELWDPLTGRTQEILTWREENGRTLVPLHFEPEGSLFVVFRKKAAIPPHVVAIEKDSKHFFPGNAWPEQDRPLIEMVKTGTGVSIMAAPGDYTFTWSNGQTSTLHSGQPGLKPLTGVWTLSFDTAWGGPAQVEVDSLQSWTSFAESGIKYYSGSATYKKTFTIPAGSLKGTKTILDLGNVLEMVFITVNGHKSPTRWCAPFRFDITPYVRAGNNTLEVEVVNMWPNRLIGDSRLPVSQRRTRTNIKKFEQPGAEQLLRPAGLLGPVSISFLPIELLKGLPGVN